jgi:hypothetical protein
VFLVVVTSPEPYWLIPAERQSDDAQIFTNDATSLNEASREISKASALEAETSSDANRSEEHTNEEQHEGRMSLRILKSSASRQRNTPSNFDRHSAHGASSSSSERSSVPRNQLRRFNFHRYLHAKLIQSESTKVKG